MLRLSQYLSARNLTKAEFGRRLEERLGHSVPKQSLHRWTLAPDDPGFNVPRSKIIRAIAAETDGEVDAASWFSDGERPKRKPRAAAISVAASRKAAATRKRQKKINPLASLATLHFYKERA